MRPVLLSEINEACSQWLDDPSAHSTRAVGPSSTDSFNGLAIRWFRFHNSLAPSEPIDELDRALRSYLDFHRPRLSGETLRGLKSHVMYFLAWARSQSLSLQSMKLIDVENYLVLKRTQGCKPRSIASIVRSLRSFFRHANDCGWTASRFTSEIRSPRVSRYAALPQGPKWKDVRRMLDAPHPGTWPFRAKAILTLLSIYGLRVSELTAILLDDFDWQDKTFTVRRAKRGGLQQYPITLEVEEAVRNYQQRERPSCTCGNLFITARSPHRRLGTQTVQNLVTGRMRELGIQAERSGPHALRHACATKLLKGGASLRDIADFLGHRDLRSVSIYAKLDAPLLGKVANFRLDVL
jgi:integrase/recombinase XerD